jgi:hypothetical protein
MSWAPAGFAAGAAGAAPLAVPGASPFAAARTSSLPIRPAGPVPWTLPRSMPCAAATRRATGVAFEPSGSTVAAPSVAGRGAAEGSGAGDSARAAPAPAAIRPMTWPTWTVSPGSARI